MLYCLNVYKVLKIDKNDLINGFLRVRNVINEIFSLLSLFFKIQPFLAILPKKWLIFLEYTSMFTIILNFVHEVYLHRILTHIGHYFATFPPTLSPSTKGGVQHRHFGAPVFALPAPVVALQTFYIILNGCLCNSGIN